MGHEFSGTVDALGEGAEGPAVGTRVAVIPHLVCGKCDMCQKEIYNFCESLRCTGAEADGAHCEFISMPKQMVIPIPEAMWSATLPRKARTLGWKGCAAARKRSMFFMTAWGKREWFSIISWAWRAEAAGL